MLDTLMLPSLACFRRSACWSKASRKRAFGCVAGSAGMSLGPISRHSPRDSRSDMPSARNAVRLSACARGRSSAGSIDGSCSSTTTVADVGAV
eukprot:6153277-Prymnesium_polylepis.1